jgi:hypothetical protein
MLQGRGKDRSQAFAAAADRGKMRNLAGSIVAVRQNAVVSSRRNQARLKSHFFALLDQHSAHAVKFS